MTARNMTNIRIFIYKTIVKLTVLSLYMGVIIQGILATPINIPIHSVSSIIIQSALDSLNQDSPMRHTYKGGNVINAQKLLQQPYVIYRLTLSLEPVCNEESSCPHEACVIDLKQNERDVIEVDKKTTQCMYLYPQWNQDENQLSSEGMQDFQEQVIIENSDKQIINDTVKLDHEVQDVTDQNDKPFIAVRALHYCPGCPYELNPTLPGLEAFREVAAISLDTSGRNNYKHKVIRIVYVTRAVPPGSDVVRYELLMEIGQTNCPITMSIHRTECPLSNQPIELCLFTFDERSWLSNSRQLIRSNCTESHDIANTTNSNVKPNLVSESLTNRNSDIDEDVAKTEIYDQIAQEGQINTFESPIASSLDIPISTITSDRDDIIRTEITEMPFTQILRNTDNIAKYPIEGFTDKIKEFNEFLKDFDIPIRDNGNEKTPIYGQEVIEEIIRPEHIEHKVNVKNDVSNIELSRKKRSISHGQPSQKKFIMKLAEKAIKRLDELDEDDNKRVIIDVLEFDKVQNNEDISYYITIIVATTNCKESQNNIKNCIHNESESYKICKVEIRTDEDNSLDSIKVKSCECEKKKEGRANRKSRKSRPGKEKLIPIDDMVKKHVATALRNYSTKFDSDKAPQLVEIINATTQVVSGTLLKINIKIGESNCPKEEIAETCLLVENSPIENCLVSVWSQPWLNNDSNITVMCKSESSTRKKRSLHVNYSNKMLNMTQEWAHQSDFAVNHTESQQPDKHNNRFLKEHRVSPVLGRQEPIDIDDDVKKHVAAGLKYYSASAAGNNEVQLVKIINATRQIVAGTILNINVKVGESNCTKGQMTETCLLVENSPIKDCTISVWSQPWVHKDPKITVKCELSSSSDSRKKRSLRGKHFINDMMVISQELTDELHFNAFQLKYNKIYDSQDEKVKRFSIFKANMRIAEKFQKYEQGTAEYGATQFADMTPEEFREYTGYRRDLKVENAIPYPMADIPDIKLDPEFDWRKFNVVTPVKDQGSCGSCWAFSVTGNVEGQYAIKHKKLLSLSEQELVDCDKIDEGCNGGLQENAYRALEELGGLELESDYPYDAEDETCHFKKSKAKVQIVSAVNITSNETQMAQWLVKNGPMAIGINANAMQFYMGGISHPLSFLCNKDNLDHGVLIVGYGIHTYPIFKKKYPYWIVKNSWGTSWGEQGYYRVYRGDGTCGLNTDVTSAIVV